MLRIPKRSEVMPRTLGLEAVLRRERTAPRLVHGHFLHAVGPAAVRLGPKLGVPVVLTALGTDVHWLADGGIQERHRAAMLAACRRADRVVALSSRMAETLVDAGVPADRIATIPLGVDARVFRPQPARWEIGIDPAVKLVLFAGQATVEKGFEVLHAALERLPGVVCAAAGSGSLDSSRVRPLGILEPAALARWMAAADVVCLPSFAEGMPVVVEEALACGTPVVATRVGGIPEQIEPGRNGLLVEPGRPDELAGALREALDREWRRDEIHAGSARFWWSTVGARIAEIYDSLLG
jgi:glycosyltransferase involved in cell wall biosynthesis